MPARASTVPANRIPWPPKPAKIVERSIVRPPRRARRGRPTGRHAPLVSPVRRMHADRVGLRDLGRWSIDSGARHAPAHRAVGEDLDDREAAVLELDLASPA